MAFEKIKKYFAKKALARENLLTYEEMIKQDRISQKAEITSMFEEDQIGKMRKEKSAVKNCSIKSTIMYTENGILVKTQKSDETPVHYMEMPSYKEEERLNGYIKVETEEGKAEVIYIDAVKSYRLEYNNRRKNYETESIYHSVVYSKDGENFVEIKSSKYNLKDVYNKLEELVNAEAEKLTIIEKEQEIIK